MVSLKSQQILTDTLSCLRTGSIILSATSLSSSFSTKGIIEYGKERALQNRGETPGMMCILALYSLPGFLVHSLKCPRVFARPAEGPHCAAR